MRGSRQSLPTLIEESSNTKTLCELATAIFDNGQAYSNSKVWKSKPNICKQCDFAFILAIHMKTHSGDRHLANDVTLLLLLGVIWGSLSWANQMFANDVILLLFLRIIWGSLSKHITLYLILNANREVTRSGGPTSLILTSWTLQLSRKGGCLNKILVFFVVWISLIIFILMAIFGKDRRSILCNPVHKIDAGDSWLFRAPESFEGAARVQRETIWLDGENQLRFCQPILVGNVCCLHWLIY